MNIRNAIAIILAMISRRLSAQKPTAVGISNFSLALPDPDKMTYHFAGKVFNLVIDDRKVTLTAKEIADALGAK
ncbi:MAG: hypothetical protein WC655_13520 [Candidatus Hydrogenedentales bacterium]|jgi:hypothetical protein